MPILARVAAKLQKWDAAKHRREIADLDRCLFATAQARSTATLDAARTSLSGVVRRAWAAGAAIDLADLSYGPSHSANRRQIDGAHPYYFFLAGLVRSEKCQRIFEVGTYCGGSIMAMARGIADPTNARLATVDIADAGSKIDCGVAIETFIGNANSEHVLKSVLAYFGPEPIDLLYLDGEHAFLPTITNVGLYASMLRPRYVVLDDILLNESMRSAWSALRCSYAGALVDCIDVVPEIRPATCGFGLLKLR